MDSTAALYDHRPTSRRGWVAVAGEAVRPYVRVSVEDRLAQVLDEFRDPARLARLDDAALVAQGQVARKLEGAAALVTARMVRELRNRDHGGQTGSTEWLKSTGRSAREAARAARLASSLDDLPETAAALAEVDIGTEAADAIVQAARGLSLGSPSEVEGQLLPVATGSSPEDIRREVRMREQAAVGDELLRDERRQHAKRRLTVTQAEDGMRDVHGRLTAETGSMLRTWLDAFDTPDRAGTPPEMARRPEQRLADALNQGVAAALDAGTTPQNGGVARPHLLVVIDVDTFDADLTDPDDRDRPVPPSHPLWAELSAGEETGAASSRPRPSVDCAATPVCPAW